MESNNQSKIQMGIPRFYRWLKERYPLIRYDLSDSGKTRPSFDNCYIDFNAIVYQCIRESGCFLKNKIKPLTFQRIYQRVIEYMLELVRLVNPQKLLFIAFDGVAPRAKINQSRDRRFRSGVEDIEFFEKLAQDIGITTKQNFEVNSISPGTDFLFNLCSTLRAKIMELMDTEWKALNVFYSDCCVPGEGEHKIMDFIRFSKQAGLFNDTTTHCVYSPDADVILLTLALNVQNICIIKEDTSVLPSMNWTATSTFRKLGPPLFQLVFINILRQYLECEFEAQMKVVAGCTIQHIINDFVLLMAFIGNDFLPVEFCFVLKDNHMDALFNSYKQYLKKHQQFINNEGAIDWKNVFDLLEVAKKFEANRISEMKIQRRQKKHEVKEDESVFDDEKKEEDNLNSQIQQFEVQDEKIVNGINSYYQSRFNIQDIKHNVKFIKIIQKYIQGLEFYCQYYYKGLPSWTWFYPFHYTPLLTDVYDFLKTKSFNVQLKKDQPFDPILALMFMLPEPNFCLLPRPLADAMTDNSCPLRNPKDYYPRQFSLDKFQTLRYNKRAMIDFLNEQEVKKVYESVPKERYTKAENERNMKKNPVLFYHSQGKFIGLECSFSQKYAKQLKGLIGAKYEGQQNQSHRRRFPTLKLYGGHTVLNEKGRVVSQSKYSGNLNQIAFFNNFVGYVQKVEKATAVDREEIQKQYQKKAFVSGMCQQYYIVNRAQYVRQFGRHHLMLTRREVKVPDFALFKMPNYDYLPKTETFEWKQMFQPGERVVVLSEKYFGCTGSVVEVGDKQLKVRLSGDPIKIKQSCFYQVDQQFYSINFVLKQLSISRQTLFAIISQVILLPTMKKGSFNERMPNALNFGLNFIDIANAKIVPRFVRCNFQHQYTKTPQKMFDSIEISQTGLKILQQYIRKMLWLVEILEDCRSWKPRRQIKVGSVFGREKDPNLRLYRQFIKLYELDTKGSFCSFYSKTADLNNLPTVYTEKKCENATVTLQYWQIISSRLASKCGPAFKNQPEYHDLGSRVILLKSLQVGYVVCIDDCWMHVIVGKERHRVRVHFRELFNESWSVFLQKDLGKCWNQEVGYYRPTYWKKAIE